MRKAGVLLSTTGLYDNVVKIRPPMVFSKENADQLVNTLDRVLSGL
jgi:4-aminobutyrate aminotransferase-like enzyme